MTVLRSPFPVLHVRSRPISWPALGLVALVGVSALVRSAIAWHHDIARYMPDEYIYSQLGWTIAHGHLMVRDQPAHFPAILEPVLAAPLWRFFSIETAYRLIQIENAIALSLAAVPVYALARHLGLTRGWAYGCAIYTLAAPMLAMSPFITADFVAYPLVLGAIAVGVKALDEPTARRQVAFLALAALATLARTQYFVLVPAYLGAAILLERRAFVRRHKAAALALAPITLCLVVAATGFYSGIRHLLLREAILTWIPLQAFLMTLVAGVAIVPGAISAVLSPEGRRARAFALMSALTAALLLGEASVYAASSGEFKERYLFVLLPLLAVAYGLHVRKGRHHSWTVVIIAAAVAAAAARLPVSIYATGAGRFDSQFLGALETFQGTLGAVSSSLIVAAIATIGAGCAIVIALYGRGSIGLGISLCIALAATGLAVHRDFEETSSLRAGLPADLSWVDDSAHGVAVTAITTPLSSPGKFLVELFWNRSVNREIALDDAEVTDLYVKEQLQIAPDGTLRNVHGPFLFDESGSWAKFAGVTLLRREGLYSLWKPEGAPRFRVLLEGYYPDHWLIPGGRIRAWPARKANRVRLTFALSLPQDAPHEVRMRLGSLRVAVRPGETIPVACTSRAGKSHLEFTYFSRDGRIDAFGRPLTLQLTKTKVADVPRGAAASNGCARIPV